MQARCLWGPPVYWFSEIHSAERYSLKRGLTEGYVRGLPAGDRTGLTYREWSSRVGVTSGSSVKDLNLVYTLRVRIPEKVFEPGVYSCVVDG